MNIKKLWMGKKTITAFAAILFMFQIQHQAWAEPQQEAWEQLMPLIGGALVEAGGQHWSQVETELKQFEKLWKELHAASTPLSKGVDTALADARKALALAEASPEEAYQAVSALSRAVDKFTTAQASVDQGDGKKDAATLLPLLKQCLADIRQQDWSGANESYDRFESRWRKIESVIRSDNAGFYGSIETTLTMARIALKAEPPKADNAEKGINILIQTVNDYMAGKSVKEKEAAGVSGGKQSVADAIALLQKAESSAESANYAEAFGHIQAFIQIWTAVEGEVQTRAPGVYAEIENQMAEAASHLTSNPPHKEKALRIIGSMESELQPFTKAARYSAWDAGLILFREGVEALLVLAALLAFLHRTGNSAKQRWIWSGTGAGLLLSGVLAIVLTYAVAKVSAGSTRETFEGVTGLVSVALMLTVGAWLHKKSNIRGWNRYIEQKMGFALAAGNLWSLFVIACLAILREGAETAVFYIGMAPSIEPSQLVLGICGALAVLLLLGYILIKGSVRLPIRPFFLVATVFIYYMVVKFLGESIHALQVSGTIPAHVEGFFPTANVLGVYPTWETFVPQLLVLAFIMIQIMRTERKKKATAEPLNSNRI